MDKGEIMFVVQTTLSPLLLAHFQGHLCRSEILFEMKQFTSALMSSLKALVIDPADPFAKPIMARVGIELASLFLFYLFSLAFARSIAQC
jgi:hypothetical protein